MGFGGAPRSPGATWGTIRYVGCEAVAEGRGGAGEAAPPAPLCPSGGSARLYTVARPNRSPVLCRCGGPSKGAKRAGEGPRGVFQAAPCARSPPRAPFASFSDANRQTQRGEDWRSAVRESGAGGPRGGRDRRSPEKKENKTSQGPTLTGRHSPLNVWLHSPDWPVGSNSLHTLLWAKQIPSQDPKGKSRRRRRFEGRLLPHPLTPSSSSPHQFHFLSF